MTNVICPKCHSVVPPWHSCLNCYTSLAGGSELATDSAVSFSESPPLTKDEAPFGITSRMASQVISGMASQIDPNLFKWIQRRDHGFRKLQSAAQPLDQLGVIARVKEIETLEAIPGVEIATRIKPIADDDPTWIVTALIPLKDIEQIRAQDFVVSLKASQRIRPSVETTVREIGARKPEPPGELLADGGRNVIVGIVDFGMDFMHRNFRLPGVDGASRILALWDQTATAGEGTPAPFGYGRVHTKEKIDAALLQKEKHPYKALGYGPPPDSMFLTGAHGTYVADVAAGNGKGSGSPGVAPNADIVFVEISTKGVPSSQDDVVGNTLGDTKQLVDAVKFIFDFAEERGQPCVINLSLGTNGGPHDGRTLVEMAIDRLVSEAPNRAVVIAASNLSGKKLHVRGKVDADPNKPTEIKWRIFSNDSTINELEIWYSKDDKFDVEVVKPNEITKINVEFGEKASCSVGEKSTMVVVNRKNDPNDEDNTINVFFEREIMPGTWTLRLRGASVSPGGGGFHAWIERDEAGQSRFEQSATSEFDNECTLGSIACGEKSIVVGAYDARDLLLKASDSSGRGPTRKGGLKPEVSAPGQDILAAHSGTLVQRHRESGTSMAAPAVTGVVALMLAEAMDKEIPLHIDTTRKILIDTARQNPPEPADAGTDKKWDAQYGYGRVSASEAVAAVSKLVKRSVVPQGAD